MSTPTLRATPSKDAQFHKWISPAILIAVVGIFLLLVIVGGSTAAYVGVTKWQESKQAAKYQEVRHQQLEDAKKAGNWRP